MKLTKNFSLNFLGEHANVSKNRSIFTRWLGFKGHLNQVVADPNYLVMFRAMSEVRGEKISEEKMFATIKLSMITLLNEYRQNSWFISRSKNKAIKSLIGSVENAHTLDEVITLLQQAKLQELGKDRKEQQTFWRKHIKPIHSKGHSRLQTTLDRALSVTAFLSHKKVDSNFVQQLTEELREFNRGTDIPQFTSLDSFKVAEQSFQFADKHNAAVVKQSIQSSLDINAQFNHPTGMKGRFLLFGKGQDKKEPVNDASFKSEIKVKK